jgi:calcineurin-like phosphoesterase
MTGPVESVLGIRIDQSLDTFLGNLAGRYEPAPGDIKMECAVFDLDTETGLCTGVERLRIL